MLVGASLESNAGITSLLRKLSRVSDIAAACWPHSDVSDLWTDLPRACNVTAVIAANPVTSLTQLPTEVGGDLLSEHALIIISSGM